MKIFCVGRNYIAHARELGNSIPDEPVIFMKPKTALIHNNAPFYYPEFTNELHYEAELVLRINKNGKYITPEEAPAYYDKMTVGIDFTARDIQDYLKKKGLPWEKAKAFDQSAALGKFNEVDPNTDIRNISFYLYKNGQLVQDGNTADMLFPVNDIISHISGYFSVNIGDLIYTGTPPGVGECVAGDLLEAYLGDEKVLELLVK